MWTNPLGTHLPIAYSPSPNSQPPAEAANPQAPREAMHGEGSNAYSPRCSPCVTPTLSESSPTEVVTIQSHGNSETQPGDGNDVDATTPVPSEQQIN
jgi:hypothetical protein